MVLWYTQNEQKSFIYLNVKDKITQITNQTAGVVNISFSRNAFFSPTSIGRIEFVHVKVSHMSDRTALANRKSLTSAMKQFTNKSQALKTHYSNCSLLYRYGYVISLRTLKESSSNFSMPVCIHV